MNQLQIKEIDSGLIATTQDLILQADTMIIATEQDCASAVDILKLIKTKHKETENARTEFVKPLNDHVKSINNKFKHVTEPLEKAEAELKRKVTKFQIELEKKRKAEQDAILKEAEEAAMQNAAKAEEEGDKQGAEEALQVATEISRFVPKTDNSVVGGVTEAKSYLIRKKNFRVTDIKAFANAYPNLVEVKSVDVRKLINVVDNVPGLEIFEETTAGIR